MGSGVSGDGDIRAERLAVVRSDRDRIDPGLQVDGTVREGLAVGSDNNIGQFGREHRKRNGILRPGKKRRTVRVEAVVAAVPGELVVKFLGFHGINGFCGASGSGASGKSGSATGSNIFRCGIVVVLKNRGAGFNLTNKSAETVIWRCGDTIIGQINFTSKITVLDRGITVDVAHNAARITARRFAENRQFADGIAICYGRITTAQIAGNTADAVGANLYVSCVDTVADFRSTTSITNNTTNV